MLSVQRSALLAQFSPLVAKFGSYSSPLAALSRMSSTATNQLIVDRPVIKKLDPPPRLMLGPGPSNCSPRVYQAMAIPQVGHLDPVFLDYVEDVKRGLRYVWQTKNEFTVPVSATGSGAWEACVSNLVEPGDVVLTCVNGYFGERNIDMCSRYGAVTKRIDKPWGQVFSLDEIEKAIAEHRPRLLHVTHAETSTGALQPVEGIADICRKYDCLFLLDTVTSIGGVPIFLDEWKVDACYAGGQKCLSCPPGMSPITFGPRALDRLRSRKSKVGSWYLDMNLIAQYIIPSKENPTAPRVYHHTAPISMLFGLRESLSIVAEEGLEASWARHRRNAELLWKGVEDMGLKLHVELAHRLPSLTTVCVPEGVDPVAVSKQMLNEYNMEIGGGLGSLRGKVWRIGLMGFNSRPENVVSFLATFEKVLRQNGWNGKQ